MIDWGAISDDPKDGKRYERFLKFADDMSKIPEKRHDGRTGARFFEAAIG